MYKEDILLKKVEGHLTSSKVSLLKGLIADLDDFNERFPYKVETYIDFDNVGNDSEFDPYETFSIRLHHKDNPQVTDQDIVDYLCIEELDTCLCAIECWHEEMAHMTQEGKTRQ